MEAHPQVLEHIRATGFDKIPGVTILEGRWQDWLLDAEKIGEVIAATPDGMGFDAIFVDTFAEGYEGESDEHSSLNYPRLHPDLKAFFEVLPDILEPENGIFSFWNGLGATSQFLASATRLQGWG
jgi:protein arginine N-methyltransferase 2